MRKKILYILIVIIFLVLIGTYFFLSSETREESLIKQGNELVIKIEDFKKANDKFPVSLDEITIQEKLEGPIYYELKDSSRYILWFGTTLGESITYDSENKKWE